MSAALFFFPEAYSIDGPKLMGRNSAGESFLRGYLAHSRAQVFRAMVDQPEHGRVFARKVKEAGRQEPVEILNRRQPAGLAKAGTLYYPAPNFNDECRRRALFADTGWSVCGLTHTLSSTAPMDALTDYLVAPVQPWDALICTSTVARDTVRVLWQAQADYLRQRLGIQRLVLPQLPVIPLGLNTADFAASPDDRIRARQQLGADDNTRVVLFSGRLSFHAKAHPLAMYQALERAAAQLPAGTHVLLVECGQHSSPAAAQAFQTAARLACPSVRVLTVDGRERDQYRLAWAGADMFCSLSDNLQETFGLTPIEAMAAGLPVVVSDWNGYKDTVRDGIDGFRIPTLMPGAGAGVELAMRHALEIDNYDMYCGHTSTLVAVDIEAATAAFVRLLSSPELCRSMGEAGRQRARQTYDWSVVIAQYEALWDELAGIRQASQTENAARRSPWPARMDPFAAFASYPTHRLTPETLCELALPDLEAAVARLESLRHLDMVAYARHVLPTTDEARSVLTAAADGPRPAGTLVSQIPAARRGAVLRSLTWLVKMGVLRVLAG
ncbi:MAG: glycosyltransferase family 4 protein [Burkholderiaceae bacterium]|nr:glycosyltransferase family 4 protein [Burkholderiaceae bacterium]